MSKNSGTNEEVFATAWLSDRSEATEMAVPLLFVIFR